MSDRFRPISMEQLTGWVFTELERKGSIFGIPRSAFFVPDPADRFRVETYGTTLETPFGVAAGPHTQMAQNIVVAWLVGARFIELKTVQTLDELAVNKPCIDVEDEGYNVEWSQELKVSESFDEYLRAWVLIHALHHALGFPGERPGIIFNMSVGYDLAGILRPNVQWFLDAMRDASQYLPAYVEVVAAHYPQVRDLDIPAQLSDTITLSTMHGCPPDEIEQITTYLLAERGLHTSVKCNPTLLGADRVRRIVHDDLGFTDVPIPDEAFGHDLEYADAVPMFHNLRRVAGAHGLTFGLKLTNTLEVENFRTVFDRDETMYMSGRALHAVTTNLAQRISEEFRGGLLLSFAGGADCFNVADLLRSGMRTVTVCSDLLKSGGYLRMLQYTEKLDAALDAVGATDITDFVCRTAIRQGTFSEFASLLYVAVLTDTGVALDLDACQALADRLGTLPPAASAVDVIEAWAAEAGHGQERVAEIVASAVKVLARVNLRQYANAVRSDWRLHKSSLRTDRSKTPRQLGLFDCVKAPCVDECPVDQAVPQYMAAVREGNMARAVALAREDNPLPAILGRVCDHLCENTCIRTHLDQPLAIREIKRFIMSHEDEPHLLPRKPATGAKVAVIGAGPTGLSAAQELAYAGFEVRVLEARPYPGGMVGGAIPEYRLPQQQIDQDVEILHRLGVEIRCGQKAGVDFSLEDLRAEGYRFVLVAVGAQLAKRLGLEGEDAEGIMDALHFLRGVREEQPVPIGDRVGVIGAGDTAMDCARSALRLGASDVSIIYRRTMDQMPADREEIRACLEEGVHVVEFAKPDSLRIEDGRLAGLVCTRTEYQGDRDASGRKVPHDVPGSEFEIPLDTLIVAISQHAALDFFGDETPVLTSRGYIEVDPVTFESSIRGVFAGGDVAAGPSSIVKAAADGKAVAAAIVAAAGEPETPETAGWVDVDLGSLFMRRARREYRVPVTHTPLPVRNDFGETIVTYTAEEARVEAGRCLDCHTMCSLCVGVCPNLALMTYEIEPFTVELPELAVDGETAVAGETATFRIGQRPQIAVLTDLCNECGNCVTVCPTSGRPYVDKPRLYLDREEFMAQKDNAFTVYDDGEAAVIEARWDGETHRLELNGTAEYESPAFRATLDAETFALIEAVPSPGAAEGQALSLRRAATMYALLRGLSDSMPQLPRAVSKAAAATRVAHPGYPE